MLVLFQDENAELLLGLLLKDCLELAYMKLLTRQDQSINSDGIICFKDGDIADHKVLFHSLKDFPIPPDLDPLFVMVLLFRLIQFIKLQVNHGL